jgi:hypothetical protein
LGVHSNIEAGWPLVNVRVSYAICLLIRAATVGQGAGFLDLRPAIRAPAFAISFMALASSSISTGRGWKRWDKRWPHGSACRWHKTRVRKTRFEAIGHRAD